MGEYSTLSWYLLLLFGLHEAATPDENGSSTHSSIKTKVVEQLDERFKLKLHTPMVMAAVLDPRFHKLSFLSDDEQHEVQRVLIQKINVCDDFIAAELSPVIEPPAKRQKV